MMPVQYQMLLPDFLASFHHQLRHIVKVSLAHFDIIWIDVFLLECCEEEFSRCNIVRIRSIHHNGDLESLEQISCSNCLVIWCS